MLRRKVAIILPIIGIGTILGFISGVAPGYFIKGYALFGIAAGFLLIIFLLLITTALLYEYLNKNSLVSNSLNHVRIFHPSLSTKEKVLLSFTSVALFIGGAFCGVIWGLLLKAISISVAAHLITTSIFLVIILIVLVIILIVELKKLGRSKVDHRPEQQPVTTKLNSRPKVLTKPQDEPKNTASRANRYHSRPFDDDSKITWQNSSIDSSGTHSNNTFRTSRAPSTIQKEYQRLLRPSSRFYINDKVYANDNDIAQVIDADGLGNYGIRYLDNGLTDFKSGAELRKALPLSE